MREKHYGIVKNSMAIVLFHNRDFVICGLCSRIKWIICVIAFKIDAELEH